MSPRSLFLAVVLITAAGCLMGGAEPAAPSKANPLPADPTLAAAQGALNGKQFAAARNLFVDFIDKHRTDPRVPDALLGKGVCELNLPAQEGNAINTWNGLLLRHPASGAAANAMEQLAIYYARKGQSSKVTEMEEKLAANFPSHPALSEFVPDKPTRFFKRKNSPRLSKS